MSLSQAERDELIQRLVQINAELRDMPDCQERVNLRAKLRFLARAIWLDGKPQEPPSDPATIPA